ncbi:MAG: hypothetical protein AAGB46_19410, partial [Verrucomicrobiota bacterium]
MSYRRSNQNGNLFANGFISVFITCALFLMLAALQTMANWGAGDAREVITANDQPPPPPPPDEPPP